MLNRLVILNLMHNLFVMLTGLRLQKTDRPTTEVTDGSMY